MLDSLAGLLRLKLWLHWLLIYIIVNIVEFIVMKVFWKSLFPDKSDSKHESNSQI